MQTILRLYRESFSGLSRSVWLLSLITLINRSGAMVLPFLSIYFSQVLGFSKTQTGLLLTMFGLGSLTGTRLGGYWTDRWGYYSLQFWSLIGGGCLFILLSFVQSYFGLLAFIFVLSTIAEAYRPGAMVAVAVYSKPENTTRSYGLLRFAINLGFSIGPALGGLLAFQFGYTLLFWIDGITCIIAGFLFRFFLKEKKVNEPKEKSIPPSTSIFKDKKYLIFLLSVFLGSVVFLQFGSVLPVYFKEKAMLDENIIGLILGMNGLIIALFEMPLVFKLERKKLLPVIMAGYIFMAFCYLALFLVPSGLLVAIFGIALLTIGEMLSFPFGNTFAIQQSNTYNRGKYMAFYSMSFSLAHIVAPSMGFQTAALWGYSALWCLLIGLSGITICILLFLHKKKSGIISPN